MCKFRKAIKNVEGDVDVQKRALGFRGKVDNRYVSFMQFTFSSIIITW